CCSSFFFSSRRRHTRFSHDCSSDVCSSDLQTKKRGVPEEASPYPGSLVHRRSEPNDREGTTGGESGETASRRIPHESAHRRRCVNREPQNQQALRSLLPPTTSCQEPESS